jgi:hypothetical protein
MTSRVRGRHCSPWSAGFVEDWRGSIPLGTAHLLLIRIRVAAELIAAVSLIRPISFLIRGIHSVIGRNNFAIICS